MPSMFDHSQAFYLEGGRAELVGRSGLVNETVAGLSMEKGSLSYEDTLEKERATSVEQA